MLKLSLKSGTERESERERERERERVRDGGNKRQKGALFLEVQYVQCHFFMTTGTVHMNLVLNKKYTVPGCSKDKRNA